MEAAATTGTVDPPDLADRHDPPSSWRISGHEWDSEDLLGASRRLGSADEPPVGGNTQSLTGIQKKRPSQPAPFAESIGDHPGRIIEAFWVTRVILVRWV